jgi:hypothetical protein
LKLKKILAGLVSLHLLARLAVLVAFAGIAFIALGCYWLLAAALYPWAAALVVGGGLILLLLIVILVGVLAASGGRRKRPPESPADAERRIEEKLRPEIGEQATQWTKRHTGLAMIGALAAGIVVATSPDTRRTIYAAARPLVAQKVLRIMRRFSD